MKDRRRYLISIEDKETRAHIMLIAKKMIQMLCEKQRTDALLIVQNLKYANGTMLNQIFTEQQINTLAKGNSISITEAHRWFMCSMRTLNKHIGKFVILAAFPSKQDLVKIERAIQFDSIVVVPNTKEDVDDWVSLYSPEIVSLNSGSKV